MTLYGNYLTVVRRPEEAVAEIRRARELDPLSISVRVLRGNFPVPACSVSLI
jgi:hypothetical protein